MNSTKLIRITCAGTFLGGLAGIIASSAAGNNEGFVLTFGIITAIAAVVLIVVSAVTNRERIDVFEDAIAEKLEAQIDDLIAGGADETKLRALIRDALRAGSKS